MFNDGREVARVERHVGFKALGCQITLDGRNGAELTSRIAKTWQAFSKYADILCNKSAPWGKRIAMLGMLLESCLFWCSGSWMLDNRSLSKLNGVQGKMLRRMLGRRFEAFDSPESHVVESNKTLKHLKAKTLCVSRVGSKVLSLLTYPAQPK